MRSPKEDHIHFLAISSVVVCLLIPSSSPTTMKGHKQVLHLFDTFRHWQLSLLLNKREKLGVPKRALQAILFASFLLWQLLRHD